MKCIENACYESAFEKKGTVSKTALYYWILLLGNRH